MRYLKQTKCLMWTANVGVCIVLGFACVSWYSLVFEANLGDETGLQSPAVPTSSDRNSVPVQVDTDEILKGQLFKSSKSLVIRPPAMAGKLPKSDMPLKLIGTIAGDDAISMAIIEETEQGRQGVYAPGDMLLGAKIEDVRQNQVVLLLEGGERYVLDLSVSDFNAQQPVKPIDAQTRVQEGTRVGEVIRGISSSETIINAQARDAAKRPLYRMMDGVALQTVSEEGKKPGVRISGLPDSLLGRMIGLNNGDVIHRINGLPVENAGKAFQVLKKARTIGSAEVLFSRGDEEQTMMLHTGSW